MHCHHLSIINFRRQLKAILANHATIAGFKGLLAYIIFLVFFFLTSFESLFSVPVAGTVAVLICVAGFPGKSFGACVRGIIMSILGVSVGAFNFYILAQISHSPVGQAFLFFFIVYFKTRIFLPASLVSYLTAYLWGGAIVLFVNIFVFPHTAEKELRMTLVASLDHCRTFGCLLSKTYRLEIDQEEICVRDELAQSIRADFSILQTKLTETTIEVVWSKWSLFDYLVMVQKTRVIQQILTTVHTNLKSLEKSDLEKFREHFLHNHSKELDDLNKSIYSIYNELSGELAVQDRFKSFNHKEAQDLREFDLDHDSNPVQEASLGSNANLTESPASGSATIIQAEGRLRSVKRNLENEMGLPGRESRGANDIEAAGLTGFEHQSPVVEQVQNPFVSTSAFPILRMPSAQLEKTANSSPTLQLKNFYASFEKMQYEKIGAFLASGQLCHPDEPLIIETSQKLTSKNPYAQPLASRQQSQTPKFRSVPMISCPSNSSSNTECNQSQPIPSYPVDSSNYTAQPGIHQPLIRAFSYSFSLHNFVHEAIGLHEHVLGLLPDGTRRKKSLRFHFYEALKSDFKRQLEQTDQISATDSPSPEENKKSKLSMREALDSLSNRPSPPKTSKSLIRRLIDLENYLRGPNSIFAFRTACGVITLGILFWAPKTREFAISFNLTSGLITIVVAISPTLGQSWLTFMFQIMGQGLGLVYSMMDVGGYKYNPYCLISALALFAVPLCYTLYSNPKFFVFCFLALNSAATSAYIIFLNRKVKTFDAPPLRIARSLTSLAIAIGIVTCFQLLLLRAPAKRTLRLAVAKLMKDNTAYTIIFQAYTNAIMLTDPEKRPPQGVLERVFSDLKKREAHLQSQIISLIPLIRFAGAEPSFVKKFDATQYLRLVKANQLILDRNRDARMALGNKPLPNFLIKEFVEKMSFHRERAQPHLRMSFFLCTSALQSKFPLPERLPVATKYSDGIFHDALVMSVRLSQKLTSSEIRELTRYWSYLLSLTSVGDQLDEIGHATQVLFGKMEDDPLGY